MKKITSIILLLTIISSCLAVSGCELFGGEVMTTDGEQTTTTTTTSITTSTTTQTPLDDEPPTIEFEHGDNFTEDDIKFVRFLNDKLVSNGDRITYGIDDLFYSESGYIPYVGHIYTDNPIFICGYLDIDIRDNYLGYINGKHDVSQYKWYKFSASVPLPEVIGEDELIWSYLLLDACIEENGITKEKILHSFTYCIETSQNIIPEYLKEYETMIAYIGCFGEGFNLGDYCFDSIKDGLFRPGYVDGKGASYLVFQEQIVNENGTVKEECARDELKEYYDVLSPYFVALNQLEYTDISSDETVVYRFVGVSIETLVELSLVYEKDN